MKVALTLDLSSKDARLKMIAALHDAGTGSPAIWTPSGYEATTRASAPRPHGGGARIAVAQMVELLSGPFYGFLDPSTPT